MTGWRERRPLRNPRLQRREDADVVAQTVTLVTDTNADPAQRSELVAQSIAEAVKLGCFELLKGWRNEKYPLYGPGGEFLLEMERCATPLFGIVSYGAHMTGYVEDSTGLKFWVTESLELQRIGQN